MGRLMNCNANVDGKIVGVMPARLHSTRLAKKLLIPIGDKPLIAHSLQLAKHPILEEFILITDSDDIASYARDENINFAMTNSKNIRNGTERIFSVCDRLELHKARFVVNLQADSPFISNNAIKSIIDLMQNDSTIDIGTAVMKCDSLEDKKNPNIVKCVFDKAGRALYFSRSPIPHGSALFYRHEGVYVYSPRFMQSIKNSREKSSFLENEKLEQLDFMYNGFNVGVVQLDDREVTHSVDSTLR